MASTITIACPECDKQIKAPPEVAGKRIRCKACGHTFVARATGVRKGAPARPGPKAAPAKPAKAAKPKDPDVIGFADEDEDDGKAYELTGLEESLRCPFCANEMEEGDEVCLHCGYNVVTRIRTETRKVEETPPGDWILWLLPGIACVLVILMLITFDLVYVLMIHRIFDPSGWVGWFLGHKAVKIWLVILSLFIMYGCARFAIKRLIFNYKPPEVVKH